MSSPQQPPEQPAPSRPAYPTTHPKPPGPASAPRPTKSPTRLGLYLTALPGEAYEQFIARVIAASGPPTSEEAARLRQLLPLPRTTAKPQSEAA